MSSFLAPQEFYKASNLIANPFRSNPTQESDPRMDVWVGYQKQQTQLVKFITRSRADQVGNVNFVMLYGGYGTGKSHALLWAQHQILSTRGDEFNSVAYFVPSLRKDKGKLSFAGAFIEDLVAKSSLIADVQAFRTFLGGCIFRYRDQKKISENVAADTVIESILPSVELYNFAKEIYRCETEAEVRGLLVPKGFNDYQAVVTFTRLVNLFVYNVELPEGARRFKQAVYLFIDELDDLLRTPNVKEVREVNDALRHIYDSCPNNFCLVIALSAEVAELPAAFEKYILDRIQKQIVFELLDKEDAVRFVMEVLEANRLVPDDPDKFFPFDETAVEAIVSQLVEITPRKVVNVMQQVIEEARLAGVNPAQERITIQTLDDREIMEEVFGEGGLM
jgi:hypothetical protein